MLTVWVLVCRERLVASGHVWNGEGVDGCAAARLFAWRVGLDFLHSRTSTLPCLRVYKNAMAVASGSSPEFGNMQDR